MNIPKKVEDILDKFQKNKFEAYLVGGCVRDLLMKRKPKDWDIATNANPDQIQKLFPKSFCNNDFGTVNVEGVEITPFRTEEKYTDKRHPDKVKWAETIEEDLSRRDFTINAVAMDKKGGIIDPYSGRKDIRNKIIKAVGNAKERFSEDALRMMRAVRFLAQLNSSAQGGPSSGWKIEPKTKRAIKENASWLKVISKERIRDEFLKIIMSGGAAKGIELLKELGLLSYIIPELQESVGIAQNKHHIYDCYEHALLSLKFAAEKGFNKYVRLAALFHDIGKPKTKKGRGENATFYNHEVVGAKITFQIMKRLRFSKKEIEKVVKLVRYHLFYYNVGEVTESSVRRLLRKVGQDSIEELLQLRQADRIGSGCPKAEPYKLRHLKYVIEKVSKDPISFKMLKVSGEDIMKTLNIKPGPKVGRILDILLDLVLINPGNNNKSFLEKEIEKIRQISDEKLEEKARKARERINQIEIKKDQMVKKKYWVT